MASKKNLKILVTASLNKSLSKTEIQQKLKELSSGLKLEITGLDVKGIAELNKQFKELRETLKTVRDYSKEISASKIDVVKNNASGVASYDDLQQRAKEIAKASKTLAKIEMDTSDNLDDIQKASISYVDNQGRQIKETYKFVKEAGEAVEGLADKVTGKWVRGDSHITDDIAKRTKLEEDEKKKVLQLRDAQRELHKELRSINSEGLQDQKNGLAGRVNTSDLEGIAKLRKEIGSLVSEDKKEQKASQKNIENITKERIELRKKLDELKNIGAISDKQYQRFTKGSFDKEGNKTAIGLNDVKDQDSLRNFQKILDATTSSIDRNRSATAELRQEKKSFAKELQNLYEQGKITDAQLKEFGQQMSTKKSIDEVKQLKSEMKGLKKYTEDELNNTKTNKIFNKITAIQQSHGKMFADSPFGNKYKDELEAIERETKALTRDTPHLESELRKLETRMNKLTTEAKANAGALHKSGMSMKDMLGEAMTKFPIWMVASTAFYAPLRGLQSALDIIIQIDSQMNVIDRVTEGQENINKMLEDSNEIADKLGTTMTQVNDAFTGFARQGYRGEDLKDITEVATLLGNVSTMGMEDAMSKLTSAMKVFNISAKDSIKIVDSLNEVDNAYAITTDDLANAIARAGGSANTFGVSMEQLIGHTTAIGQVTRESGSIVGNSLKTIYSRITTIGKSGEVLAKVGVDIRDSSGNLRKVGDILDELGGKWDGINNEMQQQIGLQIAGRYQLSRFLTLMQQYKVSQEATETALHSQGSAYKANEKYLGSLEARINKMKNALENLSMAMGDAFLSDGVVAFAESVATIAKAGASFIQTFGLLPPLFGAVAVGIMFFNTALKTNLMNMSLSRLATVGFGRSLNVLGLTFARVGTQALAFGRFLLGAIPGAVVFVGLGLAIEGIVTAISNANEEERKLQERTDQMKESFSKNESQIRKLADEYDNLSQKISNGKMNPDINKQFLDVQNKLSKLVPEMTDKVDENGQAHMKTSAEIKEHIAQLSKLNDLGKASAVDNFGESIDKNIENIEKYKRSMAFIETSTKEYGGMKDQLDIDDEMKLYQYKMLIGEETKKIRAEYDKYAKNLVDVKKYTDNLTEADKNNIATLNKRYESLMGNKDAEHEIKEKIAQTVEVVNMLRGTLGKGVDLKPILDNVSDFSTITKEQADVLKQVNDELVNGGTEYGAYEEQLKNAHFEKYTEIFNAMRESAKKLSTQFVQGIYLDPEGNIKVSTLTQLNDLLGKGADLYDQYGNKIGEATEAMQESEEADWEKIKATEILFDVTEKQIKKTQQAIQIVDMLGGLEYMTSKQRKMLADATDYLSSIYPKYTGHIYENRQAILSNNEALSALNANGAITSEDMQKNQNSLTTNFVNNTNQRIDAINAEITALNLRKAVLNNQMNKAFTDMASGKQKNHFVPGVPELIEADKQIKGLEAKRAELHQEAIETYGKTFKQVQDDKKGGSKKESYVTDLYSMSIEKLETRLKELQGQKDSLSKSSQAYKDTIQEEIDLYNEKGDLIDKEIKRLNDAAYLEGAYNGTDNNEKYDDMLKSMEKLRQERIGLDDTLKNLKEGLTKDYFDKVISDSQDAFDSFNERLATQDAKIATTDKKDTKTLVNLNEQKLQIMMEQEAQAKANLAQFEKIIPTLEQYPDLLEKAQKETKKWNSEIEKLDVDIFKMKETIINMREEIADALVEAMKEYYRAKEKMDKENIKKEKEELEKKHKEQMDRLDKELKDFKRISDEKIKALKRERDASDYDNDLAKKQKEKRELEAELNALSLDNSIETQARKVELEKKLADQTEEIDKMKKDHSYDITEQGLQDQADAKEKQIESEKENAKYTIEINGQMHEDLYDNLIDRLDKEDEAITKATQEILEDEKYWAGVRTDVLNGNVDQYKTKLDEFSKSVSENYDKLGTNVAESLKKQLNSAKTLLMDVTKSINDEIADVQSKISETKAQMSSAIPPSTSGTYSGDSGESYSESTTSSSSYDSINSLPLRKSSGGFPEPEGGWDSNSLTDYMKSKGYYSEFNDRALLYGAMQGDGVYGGEGWQNEWLLDQLKNVVGLKTGGYTGDWSGDSGRLAMLHKKELVLKENDTSNLLGSIKLLDGVMGRLGIASIKSPQTQAGSTQNVYNLNLRIDKVTGDKAGGETVYAEIVKGLKRLGV